MIKENLIAERIAVDHYRELILRYFGDRDPGTRLMLSGILVVEEEHAKRHAWISWLRTKANPCSRSKRAGIRPLSSPAISLSSKNLARAYDS